MKQFHTFNLIKLFVHVLIVDNSYMAEAFFNIKNYYRILPGLKQLKNLRHGILPGTLWCGFGNIAHNDSELGVYRDLDMCCRAHDRCDDSIKSKTTKYGLYNKYICRSSLCECDLQFYDCLVQVHGLYASFVGKLYFKKCKQCFRVYYNPEACVEEGLDMNEGIDRKGNRVFCAKFDQNPKWKHRHNTVTLPDLDENWDDELYETVGQSALESYSAKDRKDSSNEDDFVYKNYGAIRDND
ncbi:phospholipase A2-like [Linepithema humile]|uniref:phospholipase A2-like n=1 Tax=Linepithema humile TaxID=83485 RepID=UPI00351ED226